MPDRLLTPSKITAWLDCAHYLTLRHEVDSGTREQPPNLFSEMAQMLLDKGLEHEQQVLNHYRSSGRQVFEVPERKRGETFAGWVDRVGDVLAEGHDVVFQMPFVHDGIRGVADFLERVVDADGAVTYEPVDAKLARNAAKPGHVLQLCFYIEAIAAQTGQAPDRLHVALGLESETIRADDVLAYWRRLRSQLAALIAEPATEATTPEPCDHCGFCEFELVCDAEWRAADSLVHVAGLRRADRELLEADGVDTIAELAALDRRVDDLDAGRVERMVRQAALQVQARQQPETDPPPFDLLEPPTTDPSGLAELDGEPIQPELTGFSALPAPDAGDVFLDFEGHPFWKADIGLFFLFGLIESDELGGWRFRAFWAHDQAEEAKATQDLMEYLAARRAAFPDMHVYHYNHTERTSLVRLTAEYGVVELELERLIATGLFVDLFPIVTGAMQVGVESYGLKHIERLTDYERSHDIDRGAGAVVEYEHWIGDRDQARLDRIARYNEDDVRATMAVRDWLVDHRPDDVNWRDAVLEPEVDDAELDTRIEALHAYGPGTSEHLMGDLLGYWRRERRVVAADCLRLSMADEGDQLESFGAIARLQFDGFEDRFSPTTGDKLKWPVGVFSFPPQPLDPDIEAGSTMIVALQEHQWAFFRLSSIDPEARTLEILWRQTMIDQNLIPSSLVHFVNFPEGAKLEALCELADQMLAGDATTVGHAILRNDAPSFPEGKGPQDGRLAGGYEAVCSWAPDLNGSYLPIQGPPGTGKTFAGAHIVHTLVNEGRRVGIAAMSHHAIDNLMQAVVDRFNEEGTALHAARKAQDGPVEGVEYITDNAKCAKGDYDVIGGTPWLFAHSAMRDQPVDVLVIDEAGQLGLADTLAASVSADSVILLGDPQQLPQIAQASHPNRSGVSALEHLLGEGVRTFPADRGMLLDRTWRMHPDVCGFISDVMYDGKLTSEPSCERQTTSAGTGLRWIRSDHRGQSTESPEEAAIVAETTAGLIGTSWTDQDGEIRKVEPEDVIVVTPYNDQRRLVTATLEASPTTAGIEVGTVDKFQGHEAAIVVFSMATSSAEFMPRNADFLFSKNRLNVAISRARCLAYLICTDALLDTRASDVEQMTLISALCSFVERATPVGH